MHTNGFLTICPGITHMSAFLANGQKSITMYENQAKNVCNSQNHMKLSTFNLLAMCFC